MIVEKIKAINNPLTIIAIFAALAEVAGTVALATVDKSLQPIFVWFVMGFPTIIVVLFFITLNFNPKVLYAPSDFKDEANFLSVFGGQQLRQPEKIEINKDNVREVKQELAKEERSIASEMHSKPELLKAANRFFSLLTSQAESLFKQNKLESIGFGYHSPELYLLSFGLPKDRLPPNRTAKFDKIIHVFHNPAGDVQLEVVGSGIVSGTPDDLADKVYREMAFIGDRAYRDVAPPENPGD